VDPDVLDLVREERVADAAELASERGQAREASTLFERACDWTRAAREALRAGDASRALELAVHGDDPAEAQQAIDALSASPPLAEAAADRLTRRAHHTWAARTLEAVGSLAAAADAWERAGEAVRAAELLDRLGNPVRAARVLEAAQRRSPRAWDVAVALGSLLLRFHKDEAAARALQRVPASARERRQALPLLVSALGRLGLRSAAAAIATEQTALGAAPGLAREEPEAALLFGRYRVVREVASSPTARVLECVDTARSTPVAVKLFAASGRGPSRAVLDRVEAEVRTLRLENPPHVVLASEFVAEGPAFVSRWMPGGTLDQWLSRGPVAPSKAAEIACVILTALGSAHRIGVLHRDVKPSNVLFDSAGAAHLGDFATAHLGDSSATATAGLFGTLAYVSPEQREGRPASARGDLFAVGVLLREMLTGEHPSAFAAPRWTPSQAHPELDERHDALVARLTAAKAEARPASAFEVVAAIRALPWPAAVAPRAPYSEGAADRKSSSRPATQPASRVEVDDAGRPVDAWTARAFERVTLSPALLRRARAFSMADHPGLQTVLRIDRDAGCLWLEAVEAPPPGSAAGAESLEDAREALRLVDADEAATATAVAIAGDGRAVLRFAAPG
jgi:serine/threonine-protein kinase